MGKIISFPEEMKKGKKKKIILVKNVRIWENDSSKQIKKGKPR